MKAFLSLTCIKRRKYCDLIDSREAPTTSVFDAIGGAPLVFLTWDDDVEKTDMAWEKSCPYNDSRRHVDMDEEIGFSDLKQAKSIVLLRMEAQATEMAVNAQWNPQTEFAFGFAKKDIRGHALEGRCGALFLASHCYRL